MTFYYKYIIVFIFILFYIYYLYKMKENFESDIPIVVICFNNYYFIKNFVNQIKKYKNPIILLDNNSKYEDLLNYYKKIKNELGDKITIRLLEENYGHTVYLKLKHELPNIYILSDPDLELNENMPENFAEIFLTLSKQYKKYKIGSALNIKDNAQFVECNNYSNQQNIYDWEKKFWFEKINNNEYELYNANIDTTFCLVNNNYFNDDEYDAIRVAGNFTVKHLPWYDNYIKNNISEKEIKFWKNNNISSTILNCLKL